MYSGCVTLATLASSMQCCSAWRRRHSFYQCFRKWVNRAKSSSYQASSRRRKNCLCWRVNLASRTVSQRSLLPHFRNCSLLNVMCSTRLVCWINWYSASHSLKVGSNMTHMNYWDIYWREWELRTLRYVGIIFINFTVLYEGEFCHNLALNSLLSLKICDRKKTTELMIGNG